MLTNLLTSLEVPKLMPVIGDYLQWLVDKVGSIGLAIILFTATLKLITLPLDYWSRAGMKKNSLKMEMIKPQLEKMKKQYGHDKALLNQKMNALYKKEGYNLLGACLPTIVTMVLFITVLNAFNGYLSYNLVNAYNVMNEAYLAVGEDPVIWATEALQYKELFSPSFLWIENIWVSDVFWKDNILPVEQFSQLTGATIDAQFGYTPMIKPLDDIKVANGYLILPILAVLTAFLSHKIMTASQKITADAQAQTTNKVMMFMLPAMMGFFSLTSHSAFAIYLVTSSLISILTSLLINKIVEIRFRKFIATENQKREMARINR